MNGRFRQPWIHSAALDSLLITGPAFFAVALVLAFPAFFASQSTGISAGCWLLLVVGVDVAHVYGTLFRTYLDPSEFHGRRTLYTLAPLLGWALGTVLYTLDARIFWSALAYLAVFHFIRQQYGFLRIYSRRESGPARRFQRLDLLVIHLSTLAPLVFWHTHLPRSFHWFVEGDFLNLGTGPRAALAGQVLLLFHGMFLCVYLVKEVWLLVKTGELNLPRNMLILGTALSWYIGIVRFDGDLSFTLTNVVAHGIPYMALVWMYGRKRGTDSATVRRIGWYSVPALPLFLGTLLLLAYLEEALWDGLIWKDHAALFPGFARLPEIAEPAVLAWLVPLLALPQITHYVLDGFIWRSPALARLGGPGLPCLPGLKEKGTSP